MHQRYFIGISVPEPLSSIINELQIKNFERFNLMPPLVPHITLLHPDLLMTLSPLHFIPRVRALAKELMPVSMDLTHVDMFDKRVLHISVKSPELENLHSELVGLLPEKIKSQYEIGRKFNPHITLAQAKPRQELSTQLIEIIKEPIDKQLPATFVADELTEFKWVSPRSYKIVSLGD